MLKKGFNLEEVAELTGLTFVELKSINQEE